MLQVICSSALRADETFQVNKNSSLMKGHFIQVGDYYYE